MCYQDIMVHQRQRSSVEAVTTLAWCDNSDGEQHLIRVSSSPGESTVIYREEAASRACPIEPQNKNFIGYLVEFPAPV